MKRINNTKSASAFQKRDQVKFNLEYYSGALLDFTK